MDLPTTSATVTKGGSNNCRDSYGSDCGQTIPAPPGPSVEAQSYGLNKFCQAPVDLRKHASSQVKGGFRGDKKDSPVKRPSSRRHGGSNSSRPSCTVCRQTGSLPVSRAGRS